MQSPDLILIVEDDPDWQEMLSSMLSRAGYRGKLATDFNSGLKELGKERSSALILDLQLRTERPEDEDFLGWEFARQALELDVPIIVVTGHASVWEANKAFRDYGVIALLDKGQIGKTDLLERAAEGVETSRDKHLSGSEKQHALKKIRELFFGGKKITLRINKRKG